MYIMFAIWLLQQDTLGAAPPLFSVDPLGQGVRLALALDLGGGIEKISAKPLNP